MRLVLGQIQSTDEVGHNLDLIEAVARRGQADRADLVVFPEFAMYDKPVVDGTFADVAEPLGGPFLRRVGALAAELDLHIAVGMVEQADGARPYNTVALVGRDGGVRGTWRKTHLFDAYGYRESSFIRPADDLRPVVTDVAGVSVGFMICYDLRFPEHGRALAGAGAQLLVVPSAWVPGPHKVAQWRTLVAARAIENVCYVAAVSQASPISIGTSMVCGPDGTVQDELGSAPGLVTVDIAPIELSQARARDENLTLRRYDVTPRA
jgi:predicted amidohydrolase